MIKKKQDDLLMMLSPHRPLVRRFIKLREEIKSAQRMNERYWNKRVMRFAELYGPGGIFAKIRNQNERN